MNNRSKRPKYWISIDLEMNNDELIETDDDTEDAEPTGFGKLVISDIIQVGACVFDIDTGDVVEKLSVFVKLPPDKVLSPKITKLTGITEENLNTEGRSLYLAYKELEFMAKKYDYFTDALSWGGNDAGYLLKELQRTCNFKERFMFGSIYIDVKKIFQIWATLNNKSIRSGLGKSLTKIGLNFKGRQHNALDDAYNTVRMFMFLIRNMKEK